MSAQTTKKMAGTATNSPATQTSPHSATAKLKLVPKTKTALALVKAQGEKLFVDSNIMAELFDRSHRNLMRDLEKLMVDGTINVLNLERISYRDSRGRDQSGYRLPEREAMILMPFLGGKKSAQGQAKLVDEFLRMRKELNRIARVQATVAYQQARIGGKVDRRHFTDAVQAMADRAHRRLDSTTPVGTFMKSATKTVTRALFLFEEGEKVDGIRDRLTAKQLNRLAMAEDLFADAIYDRLDGDLHHHDIYADAKKVVVTFAAATGNKSVPGVDRHNAGNGELMLEAA